MDIFATLGWIGKLFDKYAYPMEDGCVENLDYEPHKRGKNWIATVQPNRASPGGLDREFWTHGSKRWYKAPASFAAGQIVEMGGDYYSGRGNASRDRRYILVVRVEPDFFVGAYLGEKAPSKRSADEARATYLG
jgi:hypothetical protein